MRKKVSQSCSLLDNNVADILAENFSQNSSSKAQNKTFQTIEQYEAK